MTSHHDGVSSLVEDVGSDDEFYDSLQEAPPQGVLKEWSTVKRLLDPTKKCINIPITQEHVPVTEDMARQQQEILSKYKKYYYDRLDDALLFFF